ncbi:MAG TPA: hypothetical protein VM557_03750 [Thermoanaerobaculia bacterium]|nr:hypothetical protein [Thermoanaerobaculia bacterium]
MHHDPIDTRKTLNVEIHHEQRDVDIRAILFFIAGFAVFAIVVHVLLWFHFDFMRRSERDPDLLPVSLIGEGRQVLPPGPRLQPFPNPSQADGRALSPLQTNPPYDMEQMRKQEAEWLAGYGWVNQGTGTVRIPIDQAMDLALQRGFPVIAEPDAVEATPLLPGTESSTGDGARRMNETGAAPAASRSPEPSNR